MVERFGQDLALIEKLAAGGMAEVYRAKQLGHGGFEKTIAVKRILPNFAQNEEFKQMFRMEANLSGMLQHPNVIQVFGNGEWEGYLYLTMEFVDGRNVRQVLARADKKKMKIPLEFSCYMVAETAKGLDYAHKFIDEKTGQPMEIVHRDMSPQNIMVSFDGAVKVVDFGIAKAAARADTTRAGVLKGKFGYMSPEQAQGMKLDARTDVFALGIIFFELLTQRRLFTTDDDLKTLQLVREAKVPKPSKYNPSIPPQLDRIVLKALAKDKNERYASGAELYGDILRFMNQRFPKFIPTDLSTFMRSTFAEDIAEDRKKRERQAAEAPARMPDAPAVSAPQAPAAPAAAAAARSDATQVEDEAKTALVAESDSPRGMGTGIAELGPQHAPEGATAVEAPAAPALPAEGGIAELSMSIPGVGVPPPVRRTPPTSAPRPPSPAPTDLRVQTRSGVGPSPEPFSVNIGNGASSQKLETRTDFRQVPEARVIASRSQGGSGWLRTAILAVVIVGGGAIGSKYYMEMQENSTVVQQPAARTTDNRKTASEPPQTQPRVNEQAAVSPAPAHEEPDVQPVGRNPAALNPGEAKGYLNLDSLPRATHIYLNGHLLKGADGRVLETPLKNFPVAIGKYEILLRNRIYGVEIKKTVEIDRPDVIHPYSFVIK